MRNNIKIEDIGKNGTEILSPVEVEDFVQLPPPYDKIEEEIKWKEITPEQKERLEEMMKKRPPWMRREGKPWPPREGPFPDPRRKFPPEKKLPQYL